MLAVFAGDDAQEPPRRHLPRLQRIAAQGHFHVLAADVAQRVGKLELRRCLRLQLLNLLLPVGNLFLDLVRLGLLLAFPDFVVQGIDGFPGVVIGVYHLPVGQRRFAFARVVEHAGNRVIILNRDRIELMIVAARTRHRQPKERPRKSVHAIVECFALCLRDALRVAAVRGICRAQRKKAGTGRCLAPHLVADDLASDELVERQIGIERANHPVAILPRLGIRPVILRPAARIAIPRHVQPMPSPAFAVLGPVQQGIHQH